MTFETCVKKYLRTDWLTRKIEMVGLGKEKQRTERKLYRL